MGFQHFSVYGVSFSFPKDVLLLLGSPACRMFKSSRQQAVCTVKVHPGDYILRKDLAVWEVF